jgi:hypothetical protein
VKGFSLIVNLIGLGKNDPKGPILPLRLYTKNLTIATIEGFCHLCQNRLYPRLGGNSPAQ